MTRYSKVEGTRLKNPLFLSLFEILFLTIHSSLAGDIFLTGLGNYLNFNDYFFGLLSAIPLIAAGSQILWALLIVSYPDYRKLAIIGSSISRLSWFLSYFIPLYFNSRASHIYLFLFLGIASLGNSLFNLSWSVWLGEIMPEDYKGRHLSHRTFINQLIWQMLVLIGGFVVDRLGVPYGLEIVFHTALVAGILHTLLLIKVPVPSSMIGIERQSPKELIKNTLESIVRNRSTRRLFYFIIFWNLIQGLPAGMWLPFIINDVKLSYSTYGWMRVIASIFGLMTMFAWGKLVDRFRNKPIIKITMFITALHPLLYLFAREDFYLPIFIDAISSMIMWPGFNLAFASLLYAVAPRNMKIKPIFFALQSSVSSVLVAIGSYTGGVLSEYILPEKLHILGLTLISKQQIFFLTFVFRMLALLIFSLLVEDPGAAKTGEVLFFIRAYTIRKVRFFLSVVYKIGRKREKRRG